MLVKRKMLLALAGLFMLIAIFFSDLILPAHATHEDNFTAWSHIASACPVDETSQAKYNSHVHVLKFKEDETESIFARCNIANLKDSPGSLQRLEVTYTDPDGPETTYQVRALLRKVRKTDGDNVLVTEFNSNDFPASSEAQKNVVNIDHHFAFDQNAYYVEFRLIRNSSEQNPAAAVAAITRAVT